MLCGYLWGKKTQKTKNIQLEQREIKVLKAEACIYSYESRLKLLKPPMELLESNLYSICLIWRKNADMLNKINHLYLKLCILYIHSLYKWCRSDYLPDA